ncbi:MAG: hypothetical protein AB1540_11345 [Bdellovibrionota bacterium]
MKRRAQTKASLLIFMMFFLLGASPSPSPLPEVKTELAVRASKGANAPTAGDLVELTLTVPPDLNGNASQPEMAEALKDGPKEWGNGRILWWKRSEADSGRIQLGLTTYSPGMFEIPPITFLRDGKPAFRTQQQQVQFGSIGGDKSKDDIYPPEPVGFPRWVWIVIGLFCLALVLSVIWLIARWNARQKSKRAEFEKAPRVLDPLEEFEQARARLEKRDLLREQKYKPHYFGISEAAKRFLGKSFQFDAEESTTRELLRELEGFGLSQDLVAKWKSILEEMDITKFTDRTPDHASAQSLPSRISELVAVTYQASPARREREARP